MAAKKTTAKKTSSPKSQVKSCYFSPVGFVIEQNDVTKTQAVAKLKKISTREMQSRLEKAIQKELHAMGLLKSTEVMSLKVYTSVTQDDI